MFNPAPESQKRNTKNMGETRSERRELAKQACAKGRRNARGLRDQARKENAAEKREGRGKLLAEKNEERKAKGKVGKEERSI